MITAKLDAKTILSTFTIGCESYIVKPITKEKLLAEMKN